MSKYSLYYVYTAIGALRFSLGQNVTRDIASEKRDKKLEPKFNRHDAGQISWILHY